MSTERVLLRNIGGVDAELMGVIPFSLKSNSGGLREKARQELAQVHIARTNYVGGEPAAYAIDWRPSEPLFRETRYVRTKYEHELRWSPDA
jgi:hypothetical protein